MNILQSFIFPWSETPGIAELNYRNSGFMKTCGSIFIKPPNDDVLLQSFSIKHRGTNLTVGARALCKHHERKTETEKLHPFWTCPRGSENNKSEMALEHFKSIIDNAKWRNIHKLSKDIVIYEIRNEHGYGMRWELKDIGEDVENILFSTENVVFRGYLEPQLPNYASSFAGKEK